MKKCILVAVLMCGNLLLASQANVSDEATAVNTEESTPVNITAPKTATAAGSTTDRIAILVGLLVTLSGAAYFITKKFGRPGSSQQTQIKILTQHYLGPKRSLAIVRVAGESVLIGITEHSISMIKSLSLLDDEVPEVTPMNFEKTLQASEKVQSSGSDEFSMRHIKDVVSLKLKGIGKDA